MFDFKSCASAKKISNKVSQTVQFGTLKRKLSKYNGIRSRSNSNGARAKIFSYIITNLLGNFFADSIGNLFVHIVALFLGNLVALLVGLTPALLFLYSCALLLWNIHTLLSWNLGTHRIGHLSLPLLVDINTGVIGVGLAGARNRNPHLGLTLTLPMVFTVILVLSAALSFSVVFIL